MPEFTAEYESAHCDRPVTNYVVLHGGLANIVWANLSKKQLSTKELGRGGGGTTVYTHHLTPS